MNHGRPTLAPVTEHILQNPPPTLADFLLSMSIVRSRGELVAHAAQIKCAQIALKRYQADGCAADPHSNDHIQAYLQLRATAGRVSAETFMKYLASRISNATHTRRKR